MEELSNDLHSSVHWNSCEKADYIKADHKVVLLHDSLVDLSHEGEGVFHVRISGPTQWSEDLD